MSCASPFIYDSEVTYTLFSYTIGFSGAYTLPGYTTPSLNVCTLGWSPPYATCVKRLCDGCICNTWQWCNCCNSTCDGWTWTAGSHYWTTPCWTVPGIPLWPSLNFSFSSSVPIAMKLTEGAIITVDTPPTAIVAESIVIGGPVGSEGFEIAMSVNDQGFSINIPITVTLTEINGTFLATVSIYTASTTYDADGISYAISVGTDFLFCLTPVPPVGGMNLQLTCSFSAAIGDISSSTGFAVVIPIISVEEEG